MTLHAGVFKHPVKAIWCIRYYVGNGRTQCEEIGTRAEAARAYRLRRQRRVGPVAKRELRAGVFKHPKKNIWCMCYYLDERPHWKEVGTRAEAQRAYRDRKRRSIEQMKKTKHDRHVSFPKPFRSGPFEHPPGSGVWWIGYYDKQNRPGDRSARGHHQRREKIGSRDDAIKAYESRCADRAKQRHDFLWGTEEKKKSTSAAISASKSTPAQKLLTSISTTNYWDGLRSDPHAYREEITKRKKANRQPKLRRSRQEQALGNLQLIDARPMGLRRAVIAAADPLGRAQTFAKKMRRHAGLVGTAWTDEQYDQLIQNLLREILEKRALAHGKKELGRAIESKYWAAFHEMKRGSTLEEVTEKHLKSYYNRNPDGAKRQMKSAMERLRRNAAA
jgi:hypothetical protein